MTSILLLLLACEPDADTGTKTEDTDVTTNVGLDFTDADEDGYASTVDCNDASYLVHPGAEETWYDGIDQDCDGNDDDQDGDGFGHDVDCDDTDPSVHPGAGEVPEDGIDQDCDGADTSWPTPDDLDGDGHAADVDCDDTDASVHAGAVEVWYDGIDQDCDGNDDDADVDGFAVDTDCDDTDPSIFPGAGEVPDDGLDQDCDGSDAVTETTTSDADADGFATAVDCDDLDASIHPGATEVWYDGVDQDCDGNDDDQDADGYREATDCDDLDPAVHPGAGEILDDGIDQDCDGVDSTSVDLDADDDGYEDAVDCDDADAGVNPGAAEIWYDGVDQDCDGNDLDQDGDGVKLASDCDDTDPTVFPGAGEVPDDGIDQDCSGADATSSIDDADGDGYATWVDCDDTDSTVHPGATEVWYDGVDQDCDANDLDQDGDGVKIATDCDDTDPTVFPGAGEVPGDGIDQDCSGADSALPTSDDVDGDGYASTVDCNDASASIHPFATEVWYDGVDQDCDGSDDDQDGDGYPHATDCSDTNAAAYPGAPETADDGIDQDCDGSDMISVATLTSGKLLLTEIMKKSDAVSDTYGEWIEVYNASGKRVLLDGLVVTSTAQSLSFTVSGDVQLEAGGYAVFAREGDTTINGGVVADYDYRSDFALDNDADTLSLSYGATTIDSVAYDDVDFFPDTSGTSMTLDGDYFSVTNNDNGQYWCDGQTVMSSGDLGTPGAANDACGGLTDSDHDGYVSAHDCNDSSSSIHPGATETARDNVDSDCDDADFASTSFRSGDLVVDEIMQNPDFVTDTDGEWFEVYNASGYSINLIGLTVSDSTGETFTVETDLVMAKAGYATFAVESNDAKNGGVTPVDYDYPGTSFGLGNGSDSIYLYNGTTLVDSVTWDNGASFPDPNGASMMLKTSKLSSSSNNTGSNWCTTSVSHIGGVSTNDYGTPGKVNDSTCL